MNTYRKYCPNVFVAQCEQEYQKGETITLTTKRGKENEHIVHNLVFHKNGLFYYSITRADGFNAQERAKRKAERIQGWADSAERKSNQAYQASNKHRDFLSLGEPIKVGHHSEGRHRKIIREADNNMRKCVEFSDKAEAHQRRAKYWEQEAQKVNLSMPESIEFFQMQLEEAITFHQYLKENPEKRPHSLALSYANKKVKELKDKVKTAIILWADVEESKATIQQNKEESQTKQQKKQAKQEKVDNTIKKYGGFFAFSKEQLKEGFSQCKASGHLLEGEKVTHINHGLYIPSKYVKSFVKEM